MKLSSETEFRPQLVRLGLLIYEPSQTTHLVVDHCLVLFVIKNLRAILQESEAKLETKNFKLII